MEFTVQTKGHGDFINLTPQVQNLVDKAGVKDGLVFIFVCHTTAALVINEDEEGVKNDLVDILEKNIPEQADYRHHLNSGDRNGSAHVKTSLLNSELTIPVEEGRLVLGAWQSVFLVDFDEKPRERKIVVKIIPS